MTAITGYHAHVYFDAATVDRARTLCEQAADRFGVVMGRVHEKCVGPHPMWSCQLAFGPDLFDRVMPWLAMNRDGLIVFAHPESGDDLRDHRDHGIWMGTGLDLKLDVFDAGR